MCPNHGWAVGATALFAVVSQLKTNVTNAYAGSLAWSNFYPRLTHSHPGRLVWLVLNAAIAFVLMEMNVFQTLDDVLSLHLNIVITWVIAVAADLVVNKPLTDLMSGEMRAGSMAGQGFFLLEVYLAGGSFSETKVRDAWRRPQDCDGPPKKRLVVNNEESDRELCTAASGHDCLDLLAAGYRPDVIFMDLAIVSANAFDKSIDNDVGTRLEDFIVKPVRHKELIDWLERNLGLAWRYHAEAQRLVPVVAMPGRGASCPMRCSAPVRLCPTSCCSTR